MEITPKQYAQALYGVINENKDKVNDDAFITAETGLVRESGLGKNAKKIIVKFTKILMSNNDLQKAEKIIKIFEKLYNLKEGIVEAEIISANQLDAHTIKELKIYIKKITKAQKIEIVEKIDKKLIGGIVIKHGDKILDGCLKTRMRALRLELVK